MATLEERSRKRTRKKNIQKIILATVAAAGVLGIVLLAPGVLGAMRSLGFPPSKRQKEIIARARDRLIAKGLMEKRNGFLHLTRQGEAAMRSDIFIAKTRRTKQKWDGKWRILVFDISERKRKIRDGLRNTLVDIGFVRLQDSVWVYPYPCEDFVALLKADAHIGKEMLYMIVEELEGDSSLKKHFGFRQY